MLKIILAANAVSCALFGILFVLKGAETAALLGDPPVWLIIMVGIGLLANAAGLVITVLRPWPPKRDVLIFAVGDAAWVIATFTLLAIGLWITTPAGIGWTLGVGAFVGGCALVQWRLAPVE